MALRYEIKGEIPRPGPDDKLRRPMAFREGGTVEFRAGGNMNDVVQAVLAMRFVRVDAAPGAGKSTVLPAAIAKASGKLVFHVVPNPLLAVDLHGYCVKQAGHGAGPVPLELWGDPEQDVPRTGVLYISSNALIQLVASRGSLSQYPGATVFLDEAHESDACTYLVRALGLNLGMERLVQASATFGGAGFRAPETRGKVVETFYDKAHLPETWDLEDNSKPWGFGNIHNNLLVFVDSRADARHLGQLFGGMGMLVHRLESRMTEEAYAAAMTQLRDQKGAMVALLADSSFRSGFTYDVSTVIDTGSIAYYDSLPGRLGKKHRIACEFECYQARERGASRFKTGKVIAARPQAEYPNQICEIEGVEREAAAYLSRCLGFKPVGLLTATIMSKENIPAKNDHMRVLNGSYPLTYYVCNADGSLRDTAVDMGGRASPANSDCPDSPRSPPPRYTEDEDYVSFMASLEGGCIMPELGKYMLVSGLNPESKASAVFPKGLRSVRALVGGVDGVYNARALSAHDRGTALTLALNRYNMLNVSIRALDALVEEYKQSGVSNLSQAAREQLRDLWEGRGREVVERCELHKMIELLAHGKCDVVEIGEMTEVEKQRLDYFRGKLRDKGEVYPVDKYQDHLRELASTGGGGASRRIAYDVESYGGTRGRHYIAPLYEDEPSRSRGHVSYSGRGSATYTEVTRTQYSDGRVDYEARRLRAVRVREAR